MLHRTARTHIGVTVPRYCFTAQVDPAHLDEYRRRHAAVWPELLNALRDAGWCGYTLHLRDDGLLVGVVEADDLDAAQAAMAATEVNARWQAEMARLFAGPAGAPPDQGFTRLPTVFDLDAQLGALAELTSPDPASPDPAPAARPGRQEPRHDHP
jgi:L-rhamnose mutarotase